MAETAKFDDDILYYYNRGREAERLASEHSRVEHARTLDVLERHLPDAPATVLDVGGGPGRYAVWLAEQGYTVHLLDPVPLHVAQATEALKPHAQAAATLGDARVLPYPDAYADAALLLGPLYHLTERSDRVKALQEAHRVLKPGGLLFAAAISRFSLFLEGLTLDTLGAANFVEMNSAVIETGIYRNPERQEGLFTTAYFHHPKELREEIIEAGFGNVTLVGLEGPARYLRNFNEVWEDEQKRSNLLTMLRTVETERSLLGSSPHLLAIARKNSA